MYGNPDQMLDAPKKPHAPTMVAPRAKPYFFGARRDDGRDKKTSAVADATDRIEKRGWEIERLPKENAAIMIVTIPKMRPAAKVTSMSWAEEFKGDVGLGRESRKFECVFQEPFETPCLRPVASGKPKVGRGGGTAITEMISARWPSKSALELAEESSKSPMIPRMRIALVNFRVRIVLFQISNAECLTGL
jgi:hypothetical protein